MRWANIWHRYTSATRCHRSPMNRCLPLMPDTYLNITCQTAYISPIPLSLTPLPLTPLPPSLLACKSILRRSRMKGHINMRTRRSRDLRLELLRALFTLKMDTRTIQHSFRLMCPVLTPTTATLIQNQTILCTMVVHSRKEAIIRSYLYYIPSTNSAIDSSNPLHPLYHIAHNSQ